MNKINLIIGREYWTRVKSKTFLLTTFLAPIAIIAIYAVLGFLMTRGSDKIKTIAIIDNADITEGMDLKKNNLIFELTAKSLDELKESYNNGDIVGIIELPPIDTAQTNYDLIFHADKTLAIDEEASVKSIFRKRVRDFKVKALGIDESQLSLIDTDITIAPETINQTDKEISSLTSIVSSGVGIAVGFILFFVILVFGSQVMRGVNEEKINRIIEVLISSVKPIELMVGKIMGIGLVGLTQFAIWSILLTILGAGSLAFLGISTSPDITTDVIATDVIASSDIQATIEPIFKVLMGINWALVIPLYIVYFFVGYLIYSSLFAAVGAAAGDDINEAQSLTTVVMLPLMAAFYIAFAATRAPESSLAVWSSIFPLTAPVVMPVRLATDPPAWQIITSLIVCILFVVFMIWLASRIYRVGILMYGKKASFKELGKWVFYKG